MSKIDELISSTDILSEEFNLYRPNLKRSVAAVLPEIIKHLNYEIDLPANTVLNNDIAKSIDESFPSGYDRAIFIIADGVGAQHLTDIGGMLANNINNKGTVASTVFPSMTSTVMSSLSYGLFPSAHGVLGYNIYNESIDDIWSALAMKYRKDGEERLVLDDFMHKDLIHGESLIKLISDISNPFIYPAQLGEPSLMDLIIPDYPVIKYHEIPKAVQLIGHHSMNNQFTGFYYPAADHYGHHHGPESAEYRQAIHALDQIIVKLMELPHVKDGSTAIIVTSDHGQSTIDHSISKWMSREQWYGLREKGITLSSSGRTIHAYCIEEAKDMGKETLEKMTNNHGIVIDNEEAMRLAGSQIADNGYGIRMGDYVMITEENYMYDVPERVVYEDETRLFGQHGSLSIPELIVPVGIFGGEE